MNRILFLCVLLAGYVAGNTLYEGYPDVIAAQSADPIPLDVENNPEASRPEIVTLQAANPPRNCAGVGQACAAHGDCCTNSCFGLLRSCVPNLGFSLNLQIGSPTGS